MSTSADPSSEDEGDAAFEAELRAEVQADLDERLARVDADAPEPDPGPELPETEEDGDERGVWDDPEEDPDDLEGGPVVMRPFPGMGGHNPIVGGGNLIAAFEEEVDPSAGYLVGELPGEELFSIEGPKPGEGRQVGFMVVIAMCFLPLVAIAFGVEDFLPAREFERLIEYSFLWTLAWGVVLALIMLSRALYDGGRAVCTSEGIGIESGSSAVWIPWDEVSGYALDEEVVTLDSAEGSVKFSATPEEAGRLILLLDQRGVPRR